jgi:hypothetical protein
VAASAATPYVMSAPFPSSAQNGASGRRGGRRHHSAATVHNGACYVIRYWPVMGINAENVAGKIHSRFIILCPVGMAAVRKRAISSHCARNVTESSRPGRAIDGIGQPVTRWPGQSLHQEWPGMVTPLGYTYRACRANRDILAFPQVRGGAEISNLPLPGSSLGRGSGDCEYVA